MAEQLPKTIHGAVLLDSLRHLAGERLTEESLEQLCWLIAGNEHRLRSYLCLKPWTIQRGEEWVPAQVVRAVPRHGGRGKGEVGYGLSFRILGGSSAGLLASQWWSRRRCYFLARFRDDHGLGFGFSRQRRAEREEVAQSHYYPFLDPRQFVTLRCLLFIEPKLSAENPVFRQISFNTELAEWNRLQHRYRYRWEERYACPFRFPQSHYCHQCPIGVDRCRAGTHLRTYTAEPCEGCGKRSFFDPEYKSGLCVICTERAVYREKGKNHG